MCVRFRFQREVECKVVQMEIGVIVFKGFQRMVEHTLLDRTSLGQRRYGVGGFVVVISRKLVGLDVNAND